VCGSCFVYNRLQIKILNEAVIKLSEMLEFELQTIIRTERLKRTGKCIHERTVHPVLWYSNN